MNHDWTVNGCGVQGVAGKTDVVFGPHYFTVPVPFHLVIAGGVVLVSLFCFLGSQIMAKERSG
jgi:hypothetical protein